MLALTYLLFLFLSLGHAVDQNDSEESRANVALISHHPYYAELDNNEACGAALIARNFLLTTAQCASTLYEGSYVHLGGNSVKKSKPMSVKHVFIKEDFDYPTWYKGATNDIALVMLARHIRYSNTIKPINLPKYEAIPRGGNYEMIFRSEGKNNLELIKQEKHMNVTGPVLCYHRTKFSTEAPHPMKKPEKKAMNFASLCGTTHLTKSHDICQSNPSSLLVKENTLYGLGSFRYEDCRRSGHFFTNIVAYMTWIENTMMKAKHSPPTDFMVSE